MNVSEVIAQYLKAAGIGHIFGYPGDPNIELMEAARRAGLQFVLGRREGTAGLMAEAYGFLTGRPGVCMSTLGPGSSNMVNAVAGALLDRVPLIAISGQIERKREQTFTHQVLDHNLLFSPLSKWATHVAPDTASGVMRKALRIAMAERPGPVHITTHADVVGAQATDDRVVLPPLHASQFIQAFGDADGVERLKSARRPIVLAGISALRAGASAALVRFAETIGCPVVVAPMAKGVMPEDHAFHAGTLDMACNQHVWEFLRGADLLLCAGFDAVELIKPWTLAVPAIHIDSTPNTDQIYPAQIELVGPIAAILDALASACGSLGRWSEAEVAAHREGLKKAYYAGRVPGRLNPTDVIDVVRAAMPRDTIASTDVGSHKLLVGQGWTTYEPRAMLMTNGLSSMGYSLPAGIAAKIVHPGRAAVSFVGDGGFAMVQAELGLASALKLGLVVVVLCDNSLNRIELKQAQRNYPSWGTLIEPVDLERLAPAMGCDGVMVHSTGELQDALARRSAERPLVIGAVIDPAQYATQF
ncbi:MAG TPA: thiamine pyrophosphate-binding protein [Burkholderiales bacterium]